MIEIRCSETTRGITNGRVVGTGAGRSSSVGSGRLSFGTGAGTALRTAGGGVAGADGGARVGRPPDGRAASSGAEGRRMLASGVPDEVLRGASARPGSLSTGTRVGVPQLGHRSGSSPSSSTYAHLRQRTMTRGARV